MAGGALQAVLAAALLLAGCGGRCTAGAGDRGLAGGDQRQIKLDAVRHQILSKLSLRERPPQRREPASPLARELALEALRRVHLLPEPRALEDQGAPDPRQAQDDDYYGRTAEIIAFAEPGGARYDPATAEAPVPAPGQGMDATDLLRGFAGAPYEMNRGRIDGACFLPKVCPPNAN